MLIIAGMTCGHAPHAPVMTQTYTDGRCAGPRLLVHGHSGLPALPALITWLSARFPKVGDTEQDQARRSLTIPYRLLGNRESLIGVQKQRGFTLDVRMFAFLQ